MYKQLDEKLFLGFKGRDAYESQCACMNIQKVPLDFIQSWNSVHSVQALWTIVSFLTAPTWDHRLRLLLSVLYATQITCGLIERMIVKVPLCRCDCYDPAITLHAGLVRVFSKRYNMTTTYFSLFRKAKCIDRCFHISFNSKNALWMLGWHDTNR